MKINFSHANLCLQQGAKAPESLQVTERHWYYYDPFYIRRIICSIIPDLSTPLMLVEWIIGKFNPGLKDRSSLAIVNWAFRWVIRLSGTKVIAIGEENIPTDTAVLYVGNHRSFSMLC